MGAKITLPQAKEKLGVYSENIASCIKCGKCESNCPQNIKIREKLEKIERIIK